MKPKAIATVLAAVCVVAGAFTTAGAQPGAAAVRFEDLNVSSPAGIEALYARIQAAAVRVCAESDPSLRAAVPPCIWRAEARAVAQANLPALTAYYRSHTTGRPQVLIANR